MVLLSAPKPTISGDAVIRRPAGKSEIVITTTNRLAGAIHSLTWDGQEFIDSADHGRQLQSAVSFDAGGPPPFHAECYNPTEAGSRRDGAGPTSTSQLLDLRADGATLQTTAQMAYWLAPGEKSEGRPGLNTKTLSDYRLTKRVIIGVNDLPQALDYTVTFTVPAGTSHRFAQFEMLTGYMPPAFSQFWTFNPTDGTLGQLSDGPGEQALPVVLATPTGSHAMGIYAPILPAPGFPQAGYGRFRFEKARVVKWNCVYRQRFPMGMPAGDFTFLQFVAVGSLEDVRQTLLALVKQFPAIKSP